MTDSPEAVPGAVPQALYDALCVHFFSRGDVSPSEARGFGARALTVDGRIFGMLARGRLVVKLPQARCAALVAEGRAEPFDANKGRPMKAWIYVADEQMATWIGLAEEALAFVRGPPAPGD